MPPSSELPPARWGAWLAALWGTRADVRWQPQAEVARPVLSRGERVRVASLHLPSTLTDLGALAACAHAAAHLRFGGPPQARTGLKPVQQALYETLEDARVEQLALQELPGLRSLWLPFHAQDAPRGNAFADLLARLARSLLDPVREDAHAWVRHARSEFLACLAAAGDLRALASRLGHEIGQMRLPFTPREWRPHAAYRDDGSFLWEPRALAPTPETAPPAQVEAQVAARLRDVPESAPEGEPVLYPEWDARIRRYRAGWCSIYVREAPIGAGTLPGVRVAETRRLQRLFAGWREGAPRRAGRAPVGDAFHAMALVDARVQVRAGRTPDPRVYVRTLPPPAPLAVQVLLDASASTADLLPRMLATALACVAALEQGGHRAALAAFASRTRHRVELRPLKHWHERVSPAVLARCAGLRSEGSTRMGAVVRHAVAGLKAQAPLRPLVVLVTDGDVHDVDAPDPRYLRGDLRRAIAEAQGRGVAVRGLLVGGGALPPGLAAL